MSRNLFDGLAKKLKPTIERVCDTKSDGWNSFETLTYAGLADHLIRKFKLKVRSRQSFINSMRTFMMKEDLELPHKKEKALIPKVDDAIKALMKAYLRSPTDPDTILDYAWALYGHRLKSDRVVRRDRARAWMLFCLVLGILIKKGERERAQSLAKELSKMLNLAKVKIEGQATFDEWNWLNDRLDQMV